MAAGDWNGVLTGRLDGWKAAGYMFSTHPWTGVGHGAYRAEFVPAKLALLARGERLYTGYGDVAFANAHNELLEVGADLGLPGLAALGWGLGVLAGALARRSREGRDAGAFAWAGAAGLGLLALAHFPFRIALVAFPALLFLAWALRPHEESA
jgi:O-antigen ligase